MNQLRYAFAFFVFISIALPAKSEFWGCRDGLFDEPHPHPIELVSNIEDGTGKIKSKDFRKFLPDSELRVFQGLGVGLTTIQARRGMLLL